MPMFGGDKAHKPGDVTTTVAAPATAPAVAVHDADHDALTGLLASNALAEECTKAIEAANGGEQVAFGFIAFDGLRHHTDHLGALVTDQVLRELAKRVRETIRECDYVGHVSRDEFLIIFRQLRGRLETLGLVARLRMNLAEPVTTGKSLYRPVVNCGLAYPPADGTTTDALTAAAEKAMLVMREQAREAAKREAEERLATARTTVLTATANIGVAEQGVRDADAHLLDSKRLLVEAKAAVIAAIEHAKSLGIAVIDPTPPR